MIYHVSFKGLGIENLPVNPVAFNLDLFGVNIEVKWYGIIITFAFFLTMLISMRQCKRFGISKDHLLDTYLLTIVLSIVGARLYYVAFAFDEFKGQLLNIFNTRTGGMAFYGGVIGGVVAMLIISKWRKIPLWHLLDFIVVYLPLGQAIGRWGNFVNQEAFGVNTTLPWGMHSEGTAQYLSQFAGRTGYRPDLPVHPTFFYEFIANLLIFFILLIVRDRAERKGMTVACYLLMYGVVRFFVEGLRTDPLYIGTTDIRVSQFLSAVMVLGALVMILILKMRAVKTVSVTNEEELFAEVNTGLEGIDEEA